LLTSHQTTDKLLAEMGKTKKLPESEGFIPERRTIERLNEAATEKLAEIVRRHGAGEKLWHGYNPGEVAAARALLSQSAPVTVR
jgi:hypothetical protein